MVQRTMWLSCWLMAAALSLAEGARVGQEAMLALTAAGYDSCPLEGFDEPRVKRLFALPREARVVMVIAAGRRGPHALIPQIRHERAFYVERV